MSDFSPHAVAGAATGVLMAGGALCYGLTWDASLMCGVASFIGALSPDMDVKSHSSRICYALVLIGSALLMWFEHILLGFMLLAYSVIPQLFTHRGAWHTFTAGAVTSLILSAILYFIYGFGGEPSVAVGWSFLIGYLTHLALDEV